MSYPVLAAVAVSVALAASGCKKDSVTRYQVEKSAAPQAMPGATPAMPPGHPKIDAKGGMSGEVPAMPPGHPKIDAKGGPSGESPAMPPGHPKLDGMSAMGGAMPGAMPGNMPAGMVGGGPSSALKWSTPKGWKELPPSGMRTATFLIGEGAGRVEVSVVVLSGAGGGALDNINRWRSQLGLGPLTAAGLKKETQTVRSPAGETILADFQGKGQRLLGAVLGHGGESWFFKTIAADAALEDAKPAFVEFLGSLRPSK